MDTKSFAEGDSIYSAYKSIEEIGHVIGIKIIVCLVSVAILALLLYLKRKKIVGCMKLIY